MQRSITVLVGLCLVLNLVKSDSIDTNSLKSDDAPLNVQKRSVVTADGKPCIFPFTYKGTSQNECVKTSSGNWCAVDDANYDVAGKWGYCKILTDDGKTCVFPFTYKGTTQNECIKGPSRNWCAVEDANYDVAGKWGYCQVFTDEDKPCIFPFTYHGTTQNECIKGISRSWCAVEDANYDVIGKWGYCKGDKSSGSLKPIAKPEKKYPTVLTKDGKSCLFPFTYKGTTQTECIKTSSGSWCAVDDANYDVAGKWGYCKDGKTPATAESDAKENVKQDKKLHAYHGFEHPSATYFKERYPIFTTEGVPCIFPFTYKGKQYNECVDKKWCAIIDPNFDVAGEWGYCTTPIELQPSKTVKGVPCKFPFTYRGKVYNECVPDCTTCRRKWCYTDDKGTYDYCMIWRRPSVNRNTWYKPNGMPTPGAACAKKTKPTSFSEADKKYMVDEHNKMRAAEPATLMRKLEWNEYMASRAQYFAEQCSEDHGEKDSCWGTKIMPIDFGQNLIVSYAHYSYTGSTVQDMFKQWGPEEKKDYSLEGNNCRNVCGHYTQVVWPQSYLIGCGVANCTVKGSGKPPYRTVSVCNYYPQGNVNGYAPYTKGKRGSGCKEIAWPHDYYVDSQGFCYPCQDGSKKCIKQDLCVDRNPETCKGAAIQWCKMKDYLIQTWTLFNDYLHTCKKTCGLCDMPPEYSRQENL